MQRSLSSVSIKLATLTAALALGGAAFAATGDSTSEPVTPQANSTTASPATSEKTPGHHYKHGRHHKSMLGHHMRDSAFLVPGYGPLHPKFVDSLALTDAQAKLVKEAQDEQKEARSARIEAMKAGRTEKLEQIKSGKLDPKAALKQTETLHEQAAKERSKIHEKWLAVWDALDETQQGKIAAHLNERAEKFASHGEKHAERHGNRDAEADPAKIAS
ncbi:hypothetical protein CR155_08240 [Pollutimonas nitritireducens]|uniref:LTXXQ motif family protein n=1 Tax=Pollutimonas nitritireducens TaxID=2045209 RepID=A0A2N4UGG5_9BURK|nr:hypothetical protein [Pollutimonas nitritireducens]PLC54106.1 hypothetical protein CR155_08240 [Pollutimonas nitritireducens]